jgi:hypothetical protein
MPVSLISLPELKTYLGITGTSDDSLLASCASNATAIAQADTSRVFAVSSNVTRRYSTDGQTALTIHDRPYNDASRVVSWLGVTLVQDTNYWLLPDRRNPDVGTVIQLRPFDDGPVRPGTRPTPCGSTRTSTGGAGSAGCRTTSW